MIQIDDIDVLFRSRWLMDTVSRKKKKHNTENTSDWAHLLLIVQFYVTCVFLHAAPW